MPQSEGLLPAGTAARVTRREFTKIALSLGALGQLSFLAARGVSQTHGSLRAVIIGHTGQGNYGHDHDLVFNGRPAIEVVAVADPDPGGRATAAARSGALRQYADYRDMLEKEKPDLACIAPRWTAEHHAMGLAALNSGAHVYLEKPITETLAQADDLLAVARPAPGCALWWPTRCAWRRISWL